LTDFPRSTKAVLVKTLTKTPSLDYDILNNSKSVTNLIFTPYIIERAIAYLLNKYLFKNNLDESA